MSRQPLPGEKHHEIIGCRMNQMKVQQLEQPYISLLNQRHEVMAVRLWDPREVELPDIGPILMEDAETGEQLYVDTHDRKFRARYKAAAEKRAARMAESFKHAGVDVLSLSTEEDMVRAIARFASLREQHRR